MFNSIRIRLAFWFTSILALILIAFAVTAYLFINYTLGTQTDRTLTEISHSFVEMIEVEHDENSESGIAATNKAIDEATEGLHYRNYQIFIFDRQSRLLSQQSPRTLPNLVIDQVTEVPARLLNTANKAMFLDVAANENQFRLFAAEDKIGGEPYIIIVTHSLHEENSIKRIFLIALLISIPIAVILSSLVGYFLAKKALSPVVLMSDSAARISATNLHARLPVENERDELGNLATVFNSLLQRLENSFANQRRFMADASHELRTPLAIVRGESEIAISKSDRPVGDYKESLEIVHDESKRLTKIVEDLFILARADSGQFQTHFSSIYLDEVVSEVVRSMRVLAERKHMGITFEAIKGMPFAGDAALLHRLFLNILDNAIKYSGDEGEITVACTSTNGNYYVTISDTGPGIPASEQERVFERFYRLDKARGRTERSMTGGAGLGLSISRWIADIHGGQISISSSDQNGSVFTVEFPAPPLAHESSNI